MASEEHKTKVVLTLITEGGKFLLIQRKAVSFGVEWAFPGGVIEEGESEEEAAKREAEEEVGLKVEVVEKLLERRHPDTFVTVAYYHCTPKDGSSPKIGQDHEIAQVEWVPASKVLDRFTSDVHPKIKDFILSQAKK